MKRFLVRLGALTGIVVLGMIAIAQAQRGAEDDPESNGGASPEATRGADGGDSSSPATTIPGGDRNDPFSRFGGGDAGDESGNRYPDVGGGDGSSPPAEGYPPAGEINSTPPGGDGRYASARNGLDDLRRDPRNEGPPAGAGAAYAPRGGEAPGGYAPPVGGDLPPAGAPAAGDEGNPLRRGGLGGDAGVIEPRSLPPAEGRGDPRADFRNDVARDDGFRSDALPNDDLGGPAPADGAALARSSQFDPFSPSGRAGAYGDDLPGAGQEGSGRPGNRQLEGAQTPALAFQKIAPEEIQVGKPATFELHLQNTGQVVARNVQIIDVVPQGTRFLGAKPQTTPDARGNLLWTLEALRPGEQRVLQVELLPIAEGDEIGSVATVQFAATASVRTRCTKPELRIEATTPAREILIGEEVTLGIRVSNPGTGPATGVVLSEQVPPGLNHPQGPVMEYVVGDLAPGESRELQLTLTAAKAGPVNNLLVARADGSLSVEEAVELVVVAPALEIHLDGPRLRYLEREANYTVTIANPGTAAAQDIELITHIPSGFKFLKANNYGEYDPQTRAVYWSLEELPADKQGVVTLDLLPVEAGEHKLTIEAGAKRDLFTRQEQPVTIEGVPEIVFQVVDAADPIEVGAETSYEIHIVNQGTKTAEEVEVYAIFPPELQPLAGDGPVPALIEGNIVRFSALGRLAPRADTTYRVKARGHQQGDYRVQVQLRSKGRPQPVTKEESTRVYPDG